VEARSWEVAEGRVRLPGLNRTRIGWGTSARAVMMMLNGELSGVICAISQGHTRFDTATAWTLIFLY
jgi:hypothetical protein